MKRIIITSVFATILLLIGLYLGALISSATDKVDTTRCEEDMLCWDCDTMGNLFCGAEKQEQEDIKATGTTRPFRYIGEEIK